MSLRLAQLHDERNYLDTFSTVILLQRPLKSQELNHKHLELLINGKKIFTKNR